MRGRGKKNPRKIILVRAISHQLNIKKKNQERGIATRINNYER
jgi:hypothetical protein